MAGVDTRASSGRLSGLSGVYEDQPRRIIGRVRFPDPLHAASGWSSPALSEADTGGGVSQLNSSTRMPLTTLLTPRRLVHCGSTLPEFHPAQSLLRASTISG